jgi:hypothetical protein
MGYGGEGYGDDDAAAEARVKVERVCDESSEDGLLRHVELCIQSRSTYFLNLPLSQPQGSIGRSKCRGYPRPGGLELACPEMSV